MVIFTKRSVLLLLAFLTFSAQFSWSQESSVAMKWNEVQLNCIRKDRARPTVQARNLFHASVLMYDCWAVYDDDASPFFLGKTWGNFTCPFDGAMIPEDRQAAQEKAMSYAMYRYLFHRYNNAPQNNWNLFMIGYCNDLMSELGYPTDVTSIDYSDGDPAKLGNYIAMRMQQFALQDGSSQQFNYAPLYYLPVNGDFAPQIPGNPQCYDANRWQQLALDVAFDQGGIPLPSGAQQALSHEWGNVIPFALTEEQKVVKQRDGFNWNVYLDPGHPPYIDTLSQVEYQYDQDFFRWGFVANIIWHSMHDTADGVTKDISPNSIGNVDPALLPTTFEEYKEFYDIFDGGDSGPGYSVNPITGLPYEEQIVPRADYTRVLSEYWADGPQSETPPGHWFKIANQVTRHPMLLKKWEGQGEILSDLEWDVRMYFALGGGIHDAAIACWGTKGYYDYTRPIYAIRYMCSKGQCSDMSKSNYHPGGIPLVPGFIETVELGDPLAGANNQHVGKIKLYTFRGPVEATGLDGVGWILGENWWTFQVKTFVTPPFAGYYSGHSTYSRTGAEVMKRITGSEYYPGGMGEFVAAQGTYLRASPGPSVETRLQWAKYTDASDQCSLSRIFGGLHPPQDDIPGRVVGQVVGPQSFNKADAIMEAGIPHIVSISADKTLINDSDVGSVVNITLEFTEDMDQSFIPTYTFTEDNPLTSLSLQGGTWTDSKHYVLTYAIVDANIQQNNIVLRVNDAKDIDNNSVIPAFNQLFEIDTHNPNVIAYTPQQSLINDDAADSGIALATISFDEPMDINVKPVVNFTNTDASTTLVYDEDMSIWLDETTFSAFFTVLDEYQDIDEVSLVVSTATDANGNEVVGLTISDVYQIDTRNAMNDAQVSAAFINLSSVGQTFQISANFDEPMNTSVVPMMIWTANNPEGSVLQFESEGWSNDQTYTWSYTVLNSGDEQSDYYIYFEGGEDLSGNEAFAGISENAFIVDMIPASLSSTFVTGNTVLFDALVGDAVVEIDLTFDDEMNQELWPTVQFNSMGNPLSSLVLNEDLSGWDDAYNFRAIFDLIDENVTIASADADFSGAFDLGMNEVTPDDFLVGVQIDTENPQVVELSTSNAVYDLSNTSTPLVVTIDFSESMNIPVLPVVEFTDSQANSMFSIVSQTWIDNTTYEITYSLTSILNVEISNIGFTITDAQDDLTNPMQPYTSEGVLDLNLVSGVEEFAAQQVSIYPNPVKEGGNVVIEMASIPVDLNVAVVDASGKLVQTLPIVNAGSSNLMFSTSGLAAGNYFVQLRSGSTVSTLQLQIIK